MTTWTLGQIPSEKTSNAKQPSDDDELRKALQARYDCSTGGRFKERLKRLDQAELEIATRCPEYRICIISMILRSRRRLSLRPIGPPLCKDIGDWKDSALRIRHWDRIGNGGLGFTELGFGSAPLGNLYKTVSEEDAFGILDAAWQSGVRYYDTAPLYGLGLSERRVGRFLTTKLQDEFIISTKVGRLVASLPTGAENGHWQILRYPQSSRGL